MANRREGRRVQYQLLPRLEQQAGRDRLPPALATEQQAEHLDLRSAPGRSGGRAEDQLGRGRLVGGLPAEVGRDAQPVGVIGQRGMRGQAVEQQHVAGPVVGGRPAGLVRPQQPRPLRRAEVAAWQHREAAEGGRDVHQGQPGGEHVLHAGDREVLVDVAAPGDDGRWLRVDGAEHLGRIGERARPEYQPDHAAQRRQVRQPVQAATGEGGPEGRIGERIPRRDGPLRPGRPAIAIGPAAEAELGTHAVAGDAHVGGPQQAAEEQVAVSGEPGAEGQPGLTGLPWSRPALARLLP